MKVFGRTKLMISALMLMFTSSAKSNYTIINKRDDAVTAMRNFFKWYQIKFEDLDNILLVKRDRVNDAPYRINFHETERYLSVLKSSGFFSDNYISVYRNYFKRIDLNLQKTKQNDGPVDGLDYDFIMHSQEPESYLKGVIALQLNLVKSTSGTEVVRVKSKLDPADSFQLFYLIKVNGKYLIDKIYTSWALPKDNI